MTSYKSSKVGKELPKKPIDLFISLSNREDGQFVKSSNERLTGDEATNFIKNCVAYPVAKTFQMEGYDKKMSKTTHSSTEYLYKNNEVKLYEMNRKVAEGTPQKIRSESGITLTTNMNMYAVIEHCENDETKIYFAMVTLTASGRNFTMNANSFDFDAPVKIELRETTDEEKKNEQAGEYIGYLANVEPEDEKDYTEINDRCKNMSVAMTDYFKSRNLIKEDTTKRDRSEYDKALNRVLDDEVNPTEDDLPW